MTSSRRFDVYRVGVAVRSYDEGDDKSRCCIGVDLEFILLAFSPKIQAVMCAFGTRRRRSTCSNTNTKSGADPYETFPGDPRANALPWVERDAIRKKERKN